jgi:hypothetical protein
VVSDLFKKAQDLVEENASAILTAVGVVGTVSTAVLTGRASFKAAQLISDEEDRRIRKLHEQPSDIDMSNPIQLELKDKVMLVWPQYIPATGVGTLTIASIIMANRVSSNKDKVVEKFGDKKATEVKDDIAQDRVNANPPQNIIITGAGDVLCYDSLSDRYFESTIEKIRQAENTVNFEIANHDEVSLGRFYEEIGLKVTPYSDTVGWNLNNPCKVEFSTVMTDDGRPCIAVEFASWPEVSYHKIYE